MTSPLRLSESRCAIVCLANCNCCLGRARISWRDCYAMWMTVLLDRVSHAKSLRVHDSLYIKNIFFLQFRDKEGQNELDSETIRW